MVRIGRFELLSGLDNKSPKVRDRTINANFRANFVRLKITRKIKHPFIVWRLHFAVAAWLALLHEFEIRCLAGHLRCFEALQLDLSVRENQSLDQGCIIFFLPRFRAQQTMLFK
jgi:hypothetical protein